MRRLRMGGVRAARRSSPDWLLMQRIMDSPGTRWAATDLRRRSGLPTRSLTLLLVAVRLSRYLLAPEPGERQRYGLSDREVDTIHEVANRLRAFAAQERLTTAEQEDRLCRAWADRYGAFEHAPMLDPVVGSVKGIGLALFAYARMRSGADAIKPDVRVKKGLRSLGFSVPDDEHAVLLVATAAAEDIGMSRLVLDQLLWWLDND